MTNNCVQPETLATRTQPLVLRRGAHPEGELAVWTQCNFLRAPPLLKHGKICMTQELMCYVRLETHQQKTQDK